MTRRRRHTPLLPHPPSGWEWCVAWIDEWGGYWILVRTEHG